MKIMRVFFFVFFFSNSTQILESVCLYQDTLNLRFVEGKHQGHRKAFTDFLKKHWLNFLDIDEFKRMPLLHNTV